MPRTVRDCEILKGLQGDDRPVERELGIFDRTLGRDIEGVVKVK